MMPKFYLTGFFYLLTLFLFTPQLVQAASFSLSLDRGSYHVGENFVVRVLLNSPEEAANAISGDLSFRSENLEVISVTKGPVVNFWVEEPSITNTLGNVRFAGVTFNPGFTGVSGHVLSLTLRGKKIGQASLTFRTASVLANDGEGSEILSSKSGAQFSLLPPRNFPVESVSISSPTHPDQNRWYSIRQPLFDLSFPSTSETFSALIDADPDSIPTSSPIAVTSSYASSELSDGRWYFHVRPQRGKELGEVSHFTLSIDTTPPVPFLLKLVSTEDLLTRPEVIFGTEDTLSGLAGYEVLLNGKKVRSIKSSTFASFHTFELPFIWWGRSEVSVRAVDLAGNIQESLLIVEARPTIWLLLLVLLLLVTLVTATVVKLKKRHGLKAEGPSPGYKEFRDFIELKLSQKPFQYLEKAQARKLSFEDIRRELSSAGWMAEDIDALLSEWQTVETLKQKIREKNLSKN